MKATTVLMLGLVLLSGSLSIPQDHSNFTGEVSQGQTFRRAIGRGLDFVLAPSTMDPGNITGWIISVAPDRAPADSECNDFVWVVTPPYRLQNVRYLDTSYGTSAEEAVHNSPRDFNFVLNCPDFQGERERVNRVLWPSSYSQK